MSTPGLVVYPARLVRTMDPARPVAEAVAVVGDRIRAVGTVAELECYGPARIDDRFADSVLFPGFVEAHTHAGSGSMWRYPYVGYHERMSPDGRRWPGSTDLSAVIDRLRGAAAALSGPDDPLVAWGLDPIYFPGERLDRRHLDMVSATRPIVVTHQSGHLMSVNSAVLRADNITRDTHVVGVVKDAHGEPTGELQEPAAMGLVNCVPRSLGAALDTDTLNSFAADARNHGVTTVVDLGNSELMDDSAVQLLRNVVDDPTFSARLSVFHLGAGLAGTAAAPVAAARLKELRSTNSAKLRFGHVKFVLDGSIQGFTARLQAPGYLPDDRKGIWIIPPEQFAAAFSVFHNEGFTVHVHCNGDEATELYLDTVEAALEAHPRWDHRHTVTHSQLTTAAQYRRMAALGMCANIFSNHIWYWGDQHSDIILGPDRASRMDAAATALRAGVPIGMHCDTPITPLDPLATASFASSRRTSSGRVLGAHERISVPEALHAMTLGTAYMIKMDHEVGSLEAGKYADFAVLAEDPFECEPEELRGVEVRGSVVGGQHFSVESPV